MHEVPIPISPFTAKNPPCFLNDQTIKPTLNAPGLKLSVQQGPGGIPTQDLHMGGIYLDVFVDVAPKHGEISMQYLWNTIYVPCIRHYHN